MLDKATEEIDDVEKGEDNGEKDEKDDSAKVSREEKGEGKAYQAPVNVARDIVPNKGKQVATYSDDFGQGPIYLSSLSPIQALKLETLTQAKASEDLLKFHFANKELISLAGNMLEKIMPSLQLNTSDPSGKLKGLLNVLGSHFESLEKVSDIKVLNQFNAMRLK